jgi:hypothetical protein
VDEKLKMISTFTPDNSKKTFQKLRNYLKLTIKNCIFKETRTCEVGIIK